MKERFGMLSRDARHLIESVIVVFSAPLLMMGVAIAGVPELPNASDPALATLADVSPKSPGDERLPAEERGGAAAEPPSAAPDPADTGADAGIRGPSLDAAETDAAGPSNPVEPAQAEPSQPSAPEPASTPAAPDSEEDVDQSPAPTPPPTADEADPPAGDSQGPIGGVLDNVEPALDAVDQTLDQTEELVAPVLGPNR